MTCIYRDDHELGITALKVDNDFIYSAGYNGYVNVWNKKKFELEHNLGPHLTRVMTIESKNGLIYCGDGFTKVGAGIHIWDKNDLSKIKSITSPDSKRVNSIKIYDDYLISGLGSPGEIRFWAHNGKLLNQIKSIAGDISHLECNDEILITASKDHLILYDLTTLNPIWNMREKDQEIGALHLRDNLVIYGAKEFIVLRNLKDPDDTQRIKL